MLIQEGYDEHHGVRPLRRVIERRLTGAVADTLIETQTRPGDVLEVRSEKGEVVVDVAHA